MEKQPSSADTTATPPETKPEPTAAPERSDAGQPAAEQPVPQRPQPLVSWDAEEYVVRDKNAGWYVGLVIVALALIALSVWLQWWTFAALILVSVLALIVYSVRPPRMIHYELDGEGLHEGQREYKYSDFKSFGIAHEGAHFSIVLVPRKRFAPQITVYFPEANGEAIVDTFGAHLPMEEVKMDILDRVVKFLRI